MDIKAIESFWIIEAKEALQVAEHLMEKCNAKYAGKQIAVIKEIFQWLQQEKT